MNTPFPNRFENNKPPSAPLFIFCGWIGWVSIPANMGKEMCRYWTMHCCVYWYIQTPTIIPHCDQPTGPLFWLKNHYHALNCHHFLIISMTPLIISFLDFLIGPSIYSKVESDIVHVARSWFSFCHLYLKPKSPLLLLKFALIAPLYRGISDRQCWRSTVDAPSMNTEDTHTATTINFRPNYLRAIYQVGHTRINLG